MVTWKKKEKRKKNKLVEWKAFADSVDIEKMIFLFLTCLVSYSNLLILCRTWPILYQMFAQKTKHLGQRLTDCQVFVRMVRQVKVSSVWFGYIFIISLNVAKSVAWSPSFLTNVQLVEWSAFYAKGNSGGAYKTISDFNKSLGSQIFFRRGE